jgi:dipeptidyl aminopeptidase/acylaminoacyl peptidase
MRLASVFCCAVLGWASEAGALSVVVVQSPPTNTAANTSSNPELKTPALGVSSSQIRLPDTLGDSILLVPDLCSFSSCPLLIVSHPYGATPEYGLDFVAHPQYAHFLNRFLEGGYALLLSSDGGRETWGNPDALGAVVRAWKLAQTQFHYSGNTYSLGVSMGALPAALVGLTGKIDIKATVSLAGVLSLPQMYFDSNSGMRNSIARAYGLPIDNLISPDQLGFATVTHNPLEDTYYFKERKIPFLVIGSSADKLVSFAKQGLAFVEKMQTFDPRSKSLEVTGPHLSGTHFSDEVAQQVLDFLAGVQNGTATVTAQK